MTTPTATTGTVKTVRISDGVRDWVWFNVIDTTGADLTGASVLVGFSDYWSPPGDGATFRPTGASDESDVLPVVQPDGSSTNSHLRIGLFIAATTGSDGAHVVTPGVYQAWAQVTSTPSIEWVRCGTVDVR